MEAGLPGYRILRELGAGGMGRVLLAEEIRSGRSVAVKIASGDLGGEGMARLRNEVEALRRVRSPHLPRFHEALAFGSELALVMEFVEGKSLGEVWARTPDEGERRAVLWKALPGVIRGLQALHAAGLVHRDLKPDNMMVRPDGTGVLVDLGLATAADVARLTATGMIVGTPAFMAPEQLRGKAEFTPETDLFQLGMVLLRLLSSDPIPEPNEAIQQLVRLEREGAGWLLDWGFGLLHMLKPQPSMAAACPWRACSASDQASGAPSMLDGGINQPQG